MSRKKPELRDAFAQRWILEPVRGCWLWTGDLVKGGYGTYQISKTRISKGKYERVRVYAHRISWQLHRGEIPDGIEVCHECDVAGCVNPDHLFLGTHADNQKDMVSKGRHAHGKNHGNAKITEIDVMDIRNSRETLAVLGAKYGLCEQTVSEIKNRKIWQHVPGERIDDPHDNQFRHGSDHGMAQLTESDIPLIRKRLKNRETCVSIGLSYNVSDGVIRHIKKGRTWKHVK
jgi:hypothetical protein